jgi:hypothetical protein
MDGNDMRARYIRRINIEILPFVDYTELHKSYTSDMEYAKGILNRLHTAMVSCYGGESLDGYGGDGYVMIPGVVLGRNNGQQCLALLELDLSSSGEHWGTTLLTRYGLVRQENFGVGDAERRDYLKSFIPYDYGYTANLPDDIHIDPDSLPQELKAVLGDFKNHQVAFGSNQKWVKHEKPSALDKLAAAKDSVSKTDAEKPPADKAAEKSPGVEI